MIELNFALADLVYDGDSERSGIDPQEIGPVIAMIEALRDRVSFFCERAQAGGSAAPAARLSA
ncbi:hypothetical protein M2323_002837 [Rhodoblastus acidophilus]|uniref:hypothetical protein n=1 Tax=Rhodoblastus acidophilus TaxID=1074 RepID=UPI0022253AC7|nr:hypothetical protein [Rhodoblastus acidophilus]MCW2285036.1 hypothetical protein [Rhodoblastus acidophilus]MCW2333900.1 hypothetical protein [Rhodoblastus acidophilus]